jgi:hypothetical protein
MEVMRSQVGNDGRQRMRSETIVRMRVRSQINITVLMGNDYIFTGEKK